MDQFGTFIGIDAATGRKPFTLIAIDSTRKLRVVGGGDAVDVLSFVAGLGNALIALSPPWKGGKTADGASTGPLLPICRLGGLRQPSLLEESMTAPCPAWMRESLGLLNQLQGIGFEAYPHENAARQWLEVPAETAYRALLGVPPFEAGILEGRIQRQLVLSDLELDVPDAMEFFEEVTRFRLLHSHLPYERILPQPELNAWIAAATAWMAVHESGRLHPAGSPAEGVIYHPLPAA
jgi:hypothetical protein